jgi:glycosyltransferase involved in cell wall biosynthesis
VIADRVVVVVPAHDERDLLPACTAALREAARRVVLPVQLVVVLDACTDGSADVLGSDVLAVHVDRRNVGAARAGGFSAVALGERTWCATTDADSTVSPTWLLDQLTHAARGADVVAGTVRVSDWAGHPVGLRQRYGAGYTDADGHRHVHGANLGLTAAAYQRIGGFAPLAVHEDVDLVDRALRSGCTVAWTGDVVVHTSSRTAGRAPGGFAQHLADLAVAR